VEDGAALRRLAELDCSRLPPGPHLVADRAGRIDAALSLVTGGLIADPFNPTADLCELLRCHAGDPRMRPAPAPNRPLEADPLPVAA